MRIFHAGSYDKNRLLCHPNDYFTEANETFRHKEASAPPCCRFFSFQSRPKISGFGEKKIVAGTREISPFCLLAWKGKLL